MFNPFCLNRSVLDDEQKPRRVTGQLKQRLSLTGFSIGVPGDPWWRNLLSAITGLVAFILLILLVEPTFHYLTHHLGIAGFPIAVLAALLSFHQVRSLVSKRHDEHILQTALPHYRRRHPNRCPACDTAYVDANHAAEAMQTCPACGGRWASEPNSPDAP